MFRNLLLTLISTLVALGLAEGIVALSGMAPDILRVQSGEFELHENRSLGYVPIPGAGDRNSLGYRDDEHSEQKPANTFRVLVLGDSIMDGWGLESRHDMFHVFMEKNLQATNPKIDVLNFGVTGYNTLQEVELFETRALQKFEPDLVVVGYCINDYTMANGNVLIGLMQEREKQGNTFTLTTSDFHRLFAWSHLYRFVMFRLLATGSAGSLVEQMGKDYAELFQDTRAESFARLGKIAKREGFEVAVLMFPAFGKIEIGELKDPRAYLANYPHLKLHENIKVMTESAGLHFIDLLPAFQSCSQTVQEKLAFDVVHPGAAGNECAGAKAGQLLLDSGLVK